MRAYILLLIVVVTAGGCASSLVREQARIVATDIGIAEEEVTTLAQQASARHQRPIAWIRMSWVVDGTFEVGLSDQAGSLHGIVVIFRKVNGRWQEDPSSQMPWIV